MDRWMDGGWIDGWMDGWMMEDGGWRMEDGGWRMEDGWMDEGWRMDGWMEDGGWRMDGWIGRLLPFLNSSFCISTVRYRLASLEHDIRDTKREEDKKPKSCDVCFEKTP